MKILVIKRDKIGDLILTTPLLSLLKSSFPQAEVHLLANNYNGWVVENNPHVDRLWLYRRVRDGSRVHPSALFGQILQLFKLRRERYDWIIVANGGPSARGNYRASSIARANTRTVAYTEASRPSKISDPLSSPVSGHETDRIVSLLAPLGVRVSPEDVPLPIFQPREAWVVAAQDFLAQHSLSSGRYVLLGIGARRPARQPIAEQILRWAKLLHDRHGLQTVFTWSPGKRDDPIYPGYDDVADEVLAERLSFLHPYRGNLGTAVGLTFLATTSVFPDGGMMHVAATSPGGVVGLFADPEHSSSPGAWGPRGMRVQVIVAPVRIEDVADDIVLAAIAKNLDGR